MGPDEQKNKAYALAERKVDQRMTLLSDIAAKLTPPLPFLPAWKEPLERRCRPDWRRDLMRKSELTAERTALALRRAETAAAAVEVIHAMGIGGRTFERCSNRSVGLGVNELRPSGAPDE